MLQASKLNMLQYFAMNLPDFDAFAQRVLLRTQDSCFSFSLKSNAN